MVGLPPFISFSTSYREGPRLAALSLVKFANPNPAS
jgi:hypothetical protein